MRVRFWGTRGSVPSPGPDTTRFGGNTSCVEIEAGDGTRIILDCGTGARALGQQLLRSGAGPLRLHLFIGHIHWDHIQGFPFFAPAFMPNVELNVYAPHGFQRTLEEALAGQMQHAYFPLKLEELQSRIHFTRLEEGFFRLGNVLIETQHLNHTAPTIAYRITADGATVAYSTDHEPFWRSDGLDLHHPGDQRHMAFLEGSDLVIHDAQYTEAEYPAKLGWGHSTIEYATDIAVAATARQLALFHHDPIRSDAQVDELQRQAQRRAEGYGSHLEVFAASEGLTLELQGSSAARPVARVAATVHRSIAGRSVFVVGADDADWGAIEHQLAEDHLVVVARFMDVDHACGQAGASPPDLLILAGAEHPSDVMRTLRGVLDSPRVPGIILSDRMDAQDDIGESSTGVNDYLARPFSPPMLRSRVRAWLSRAVVETVNGKGPPSEQSVSDATDQADKPLTTAEISHLLKSVGLFSALQMDDLDLLSARAVERRFRPGEVMIRQEAQSDEVYVILTGRAQVQQMGEGPPATERILGEIGPNEVVGEMAVLTGMPRSATVVAREPVRCLEISASEFLRLVRTAPGLAGPLAQTLAKRIYDTDQRIERFAPDSLTGLLGRSAFDEQYARLAALARRRSIAVLCILIDITDLKAINDARGYEVGDAVVGTVAQALQDTVRRTDLIARYGGDEFVMLLVDAQPDTAQLVLQRLRRRVQKLAEERDLTSPIQCRVGVASDPNPPEAVDALMHGADDDMQKRGESLDLYVPVVVSPEPVGAGVEIAIPDGTDPATVGD